MEENRKTDLHKKPFAKFHERVRHKYHQMQKRLDKSRSVDSISTLGDDYVFSLSVGSTSDVRESDEVFKQVECDKKVAKHHVIVENVNISDATLRECVEEDVHESMLSITDGKKESVAFFKEYSSSFESLNEAYLADKANDDLTTPELVTPQPDSPPPTPPQRISLRDKIGTRITAARERRREVKDKKKESREKVEKFVLTNTNKLEPKKKSKVASVTIALIEATESENEAASEEKPRLLYCRIRLGAEKYKSKTAKLHENYATWQEMINLGLFENENSLEISLWEKDNFIGRHVLDLSEIEAEKTHRLRLKLEDATGVTNVQVFILLTIGGKVEDDTSTEVDKYQGPAGDNLQKMQQHAASKFFNDMSDVGWMTVIVYGAKGLNANDCYCVLELENDRLHTHTILKTNEPSWKKAFAFNLKDMASILKVYVYSEKADEVVGEVHIPIYKINNGEFKWYALKDNARKERAKGNHPRILIEMHMYYNVIKAALQAINPKEDIFMHSEPEFSRVLLTRNCSRFKSIMTFVLDIVKVMKTLFEWQSKALNFFALMVWIFFWWLHDTWMLPLLLLIPFFLYRPPQYRLRKTSEAVQDETETKTERSLSIMQKINSVTDMIQSVQNGIGNMAGLGERVKNLFNFTVPFLSFLAIFLIIVISLVAYIIPPRYLIIAWGVKKYTRKILRPNKVPNNEILDLLSRVPDDEILQNCAEIPVEGHGNAILNLNQY